MYDNALKISYRAIDFRNILVFYILYTGEKKIQCA